MIKNWKTTAAGVSAILAALADILSGLSGGHTAGSITVDIGIILAGVQGLFAKDHDVSGVK